MPVNEMRRNDAEALYNVWSIKKEFLWATAEEHI